MVLQDLTHLHNLEITLLKLGLLWELDFFIGKKTVVEDMN